MASTLDVVVVGPLNIDLILSGEAPHEIEAIRNWFGLSEVSLNPAGSAGYPAQVFQKLGLQTGVVSTVADDALGAALKYGLAELGIDIAGVHTEPHGISQIAIYMLLFGSKKRPLTGRRSSHQPWPTPLDAADHQYLASARLVHMAGYLHYPSMWDSDIAALLKQAHERGQMTSLDPQFVLFPFEGRWWPGVEKLLPHLDVMLMDQDEAQRITGLDDLDAAAAMVREAGPPIVVIKRGELGALIYSTDQRLEQPADQVPSGEIADTIGAGDAFDGGFLAALLNGCSLPEAAQIANAVAAQSIRGHGAANALTGDFTIGNLIRRFAQHRTSTP